MTSDYENFLSECQDFEGTKNEPGVAPGRRGRRHTLKGGVFPRCQILKQETCKGKGFNFLLIFCLKVEQKFLSPRH